MSAVGCTLRALLSSTLLSECVSTHSCRSGELDGFRFGVTLSYVALRTLWLGVDVSHAGAHLHQPPAVYCTFDQMLVPQGKSSFLHNVCGLAFLVHPSNGFELVLSGDLIC